MADMGSGDKIIAVHWDAFQLQGLHEELDVPVPDNLVSSGVQVEMRPSGRPFLHGVVVVLVDVLGQRVEHNSQQENRDREKR